MRSIVKSGAGSAVMHAVAVGGLLLIDPAADEPILIDLTIMPSESMESGPPGEEPGGAPPPAPPARRAVRPRTTFHVPRSQEKPSPPSAASTGTPTQLMPEGPPVPEAPPVPAAVAPNSGDRVLGSEQGTMAAPPTSATAGAAAGGSSTGPNSATGSGHGGAAQQAYLARHYAYIREAIQRNASYPLVARRMGWTGRVVLAFRILTDGAVAHVRVGKGSGFPVLDSGAVEAVRRASPFPRPPAEAEIVVPVAYVLE